MNRKLVSEFAIGVVLLIALIVGGIFLINNAKEIAALDAAEKQNQMMKNNIVAMKNAREAKQQNASKDNTACSPHYYEGEAGIDGWFVSEGDDGIIIAIKKSDASKLPVTDSKIAENENNLTVKLIDPTDEIKSQIKASSEKSPTTVKIKGYAEVCEQPPLVSLEPATVAFKKRS